MPRLALTPTTRKWTPSIWMVFSSGSRSAEQAIRDLPADDRDRPRGFDLGRAHQPAALGVEAGEVDVFRRDARGSARLSIDLSR